LNTLLNPQVLAALIGGQMEIQNERENYIYRGELKSLAIDNNTLKAEFLWLGKGDGFPPATWQKDEKLDYSASLEMYAVSNIGPSGGDVGGSDRWCLHSHFIGETVVIYPPDGSKLDPSRVEGLELSPA
jgi:hypothetical protein